MSPRCSIGDPTRFLSCNESSSCPPILPLPFRCYHSRFLRCGDQYVLRPLELAVPRKEKGIRIFRRSFSRTGSSFFVALLARVIPVRRDIFPENRRLMLLVPCYIVAPTAHVFRDIISLPFQFRLFLSSYDDSLSRDSIVNAQKEQRKEDDEDFNYRKPITQVNSRCTNVSRRRLPKKG